LAKDRRARHRGRRSQCTAKKEDRSHSSSGYLVGQGNAGCHLHLSQAELVWRHRIELRSRPQESHVHILLRSQALCQAQLLQPLLPTSALRLAFSFAATRALALRVSTPRTTVAMSGTTLTLPSPCTISLETFSSWADT